MSYKIRNGLLAVTISSFAFSASAAGNGKLVYPAVELELTPNQTLNVAPTLNGFTGSPQCSIIGAPSWLTVDPKTCTIQGTVPRDQINNTNYTARISSPQMNYTQAFKFHYHTIAWGTVGQPIRNRDNYIAGTYDKQFQVMQDHNLTSYRVYFPMVNDNNKWVSDTLRNVVDAAKRHNIKITVAMQFPSTWKNDPNWADKPGAADALYQAAYQQTYQYVNQFKDDIKDWEMGNEIDMQLTDAQGTRLNGKGVTAAEWESPLMKGWASTLLGSSRAIDKINQESHSGLRRILGTTGSHMGFLDYMLNHGVQFDVVGYHAYPNLAADPQNMWLADPKKRLNLFLQLSYYHRPIHVNEFNCGETYQSSFENKISLPLTETCYKTFAKIIQDYSQQPYANIEQMNAYELFDEPTKTGPVAEKNFGLLYDYGAPKPTLALLTAAAGGDVADTDKQPLVLRGLLK